jgi:hypothetical protein
MVQFLIFSGIFLICFIGGCFVGYKFKDKIKGFISKFK